MAAPMESLVEIKSLDVKKGKGLYAKTSIKSGENIFEEKPVLSCQFSWNELYQYRACEYCLRSLESAEAMAQRLTANPSLVLPYPPCCSVKLEDIIVCPQCQVPYCSPECRLSAWNSYHKYLCMGPSREDPDHPINKLLEVWRNMHYPPETASIMLLIKMIAFVIQSDDPAAAKAMFSQFAHKTVNEEEHAVHKLLGKQFQESLELLRSMVSDVFYNTAVQEVLEKYRGFPLDNEWLTPEGFRSLFALMGTNQQGIGSSSISVWVKNCDKLALEESKREDLDNFIDQMYEDLDRVSGMFLNCEGAGLYRMQSACNHSCTPNAEIQFNKENSTLTLVALEDVMSEEEICISYLDDCDLSRSRHSRQKLLRENYLFTCDCEKCLSQADDDDVTSVEEEDMEEDL